MASTLEKHPTFYQSLVSTATNLAHLPQQIGQAVLHDAHQLSSYVGHGLHKANEGLHQAEHRVSHQLDHFAAVGAVQRREQADREEQRQLREMSKLRTTAQGATNLLDFDFHDPLIRDAAERNARGMVEPRGVVVDNSLEVLANLSMAGSLVKSGLSVGLKATARAGPVAVEVLDGPGVGTLRPLSVEMPRPSMVDPFEGPGPEKLAYQVDTGGLRGEVPLTKSQQAEAIQYARSLGVPKKKIGYSEYLNTSYWPTFDHLTIGTDVLPSSATGVGTRTANGRVSMRGAIAHETVGHREAALAGKTQSEEALEEAQASIRAARFGPDLSSVERTCLLRDGIMRLHKVGLRARDVKAQLWIEKR